MARRREEALAAEEEEEARLAESRELAHSVRFAQAMAAAGHGAHDDDEQWESVEPRGSGRSGSRLQRELTEEDEAEQLC